VATQPHTYACQHVVALARENSGSDEAARGLTSGREEGRRRGLRERKRHVESRQTDLAAAATGTSTSACKKERIR